MTTYGRQWRQATRKGLESLARKLNQRLFTKIQVSDDLKTGVPQQAEGDAEQHGVTPKDSGLPHGSILHDACRAGNMEEVKHILDLGQVDINCRGVNRMTPMMEAARCGHRDVVELLIRGADVLLVDKEGDSTLHWACGGGDVGTVELILSQNGVDVNDREVGNWTPVMRAALGAHKDVVELLLSRGADMSLVDMDGSNILHWACMGGHVGLVELILSLNMVDINTRNNYGDTAADWAGSNGYDQLEELLVSRSAG